MKKTLFLIVVLGGLITSQAYAAALSVTNAAALTGNFGLEVTMQGDTANAFVRDNSPDSETVFRANFQLKRNTISFVAPNSNVVFFAMQETGPPPDKGVIRLTMGKFADGRVFVRAFAGQNTPLNFRFIGGTIITPATTVIGVEWVKSDPGADNGQLRLYRNGLLQQNRLDVKNDALDIDHVRFGAPSLVDASTTGSYYLDSYESFRTLSP